jgi:hypothetical protein
VRAVTWLRFEILAGRTSATVSVLARCLAIHIAVVAIAIAAPGRLRALALRLRRTVA